MSSIKTRHYDDLTDEENCKMLEDAIEYLWECKQTQTVNVVNDAEFIDVLKDEKTVHFLLADFFNDYKIKIQASSIPEEFIKTLQDEAIEEFEHRFKDEEDESV